MSQQSPSDGEKNTLPPEYQPYDKEKQDVRFANCSPLALTDSNQLLSTPGGGGGQL